MNSYQDYLAERTAVEDVVVRLFVAVDERDWPTVEDCFAAKFTLDTRSLTGDTPAELAPGQVSGIWAEGFKPLDHVHHQIGNMQTTVEGNRATVRCHGIAWHHRSGISATARSRTFIGTYEFNLDKSDGRWRISLMRFNLKFLEGNLELEKAT